jgi:hypothetical protein
MRQFAFRIRQSTAIMSREAEIFKKHLQPVCHGHADYDNLMDAIGTLHFARSEDRRKAYRFDWGSVARYKGILP